ncbi:hypothetical protein C8D77_1011708 [Mesorhizobium loti]|uniref:Uncharacterized protein n=1 Tax=Rhizobium loti TaxID=381 RepID=A0A8E2WKZ6_RHILI|nr:hypothetical protein C8D77_1011708 [Mesorhizobium loti]
MRVTDAERDQDRNRPAGPSGLPDCNALFSARISDSSLCNISKTAA